MLSALKGLFTGNSDAIIKAVDKLHLSGEEKESFKLEAQRIASASAQQANALVETMVNSRAEIIKAEMSSGDKWTKRARPMIVYFGLVLITYIHAIIPTLAWAINKAPPELSLPAEFWLAWGTVVSVYGIGRTAEKLGHVNRITKAITGS